MRVTNEKSLFSFFLLLLLQSLDLAYNKLILETEEFSWISIIFKNKTWNTKQIIYVLVPVMMQLCLLATELQSPSSLACSRIILDSRELIKNSLQR